MIDLTLNMREEVFCVNRNPRQYGGQLKSYNKTNWSNECYGVAQNWADAYEYEYVLDPLLGFGGWFSGE